MLLSIVASFFISTFVIISIAPFLPLSPYFAMADGPFKTFIELMSFGLIMLSRPDRDIISGRPFPLMTKNTLSNGLVVSDFDALIVREEIIALSPLANFAVSAIIGFFSDDSIVSWTFMREWDVLLISLYLKANNAIAIIATGNTIIFLRYW